MITPRVTRLLRAPDLRSLQGSLLNILPRGRSARTTAVIVPTRSAAEELRRTLEDRLLDDGERVFVLPDLLTRTELYLRLHELLPDAPARLTGFERDVLLRLAADDARAAGAGAPFRLRPGLLAAILSFYDELRRRNRSIDSFDRLVRERLEAGSEMDRGAARLLAQTRFLAETFAAFERRVADSGRVDEHAVRAILLAADTAAERPAEGVHPPMYRHVVVTVADQAADPHGLWPADFDLLTRLPGLERLDLVATEVVLAAGWLERLHEALPGIEEVRLSEASGPPVLSVPDTSESVEDAVAHFVCRDREEELVEVVRWVKQRARDAAPPGYPALERTAVVFQRPLPYLYLARHVFPAGNVPFQALDALPLAAEPFAAALDLLFVVASEEGTRTALVELVSSPHWAIGDPAVPGRLLDRQEISAFDRALRESKYLGGWDRLEGLAAATQDGTRARRAAAPAFAATVSIAPAVQRLASAPGASSQIDALLDFISRFERLPNRTAPEYDRHMRARAAVLGALASLRDAHARYDDRPVPIADLFATIRRWMEAQTFSPRTGREGVLLIDAPAAAFASIDAMRVVGLVESDWPERAGASIFYPASLLRDLGWPPESERLAAARARFHDLLVLPREQVSVSTFTLEDDAIVSPSPFLEDVRNAGLPIERAGAPASARVFAHEALALHPVVSEAIGGDAAGWLQLRQGRSDALDPRYRGSIGARPGEVYAVSRVERYLECPFKYFAGHVLQLEEEREDESGLTPVERGQLLHGVFEAFFAAWTRRGGGTITTANLRDAVALFEEIADAELAGLPEGDRALERTYLLGSAASPGLAERAFAFEIEQGTEVLERLLEHSFEGSFAFLGPEGPRDIRIRGKADRIDLLADGTLRVIDYKLGRAPKPARALQLPVYGICAQQDLEGRMGRTWQLGRAGYVAFRERNAFVDLSGRGGLEAAVQDGQHRFVQAVTRIESGEFPASPDEAWTCNRCGFPHVCRKDYVGDE